MKKISFVSQFRRLICIILPSVSTPFSGSSISPPISEICLTFIDGYAKPFTILKQELASRFDFIFQAGECWDWRFNIVIPCTCILIYLKRKCVRILLLATVLENKIDSFYWHGIRYHDTIMMTTSLLGMPQRLHVSWVYKLPAIPMLSKKKRRDLADPTWLSHLVSKVFYRSERCLQGYPFGDDAIQNEPKRSHRTTDLLRPLRWGAKYERGGV